MSTFPRPPVNASADQKSREWLNWYNRLTTFLSNTAGLVPWASVSKAGSNLTEIETRNHADLQNLNTASYTHLTAANHTDLTDGGVTSLHKHDHNSGSGLQGGVSNEYYHLTSAEYSELQRGDNVASVAVNTSLDDTYRTILVTASAKNITLPAASSARIGHDWTVILGVNGYTDVIRSGSDTITLPTVETRVRIDNKGASVTFRCLTASSWGIA